MKTKVALWLIAFAVIFGNAMIAQTWGTSSDIAVSVPAAAFTPWLGVGLWDSTGAGDRYRLTQSIAGVAVTTQAYFDAPVDLPAGAKITGLGANLCDANPTYDITARLNIADEPDGNIYNGYPT